VIPEIDIRRAANLMIKRKRAVAESAAHADELASDGGAATWRPLPRVLQLANKLIVQQSAESDRENARRWCGRSSAGWRKMPLVYHRLSPYRDLPAICTNETADYGNRIFNNSWFEDLWL